MMLTVRVALRNNGVHLPPSRITVNCTPADIPKRELILDLPVAVGILACMGKIMTPGLGNLFIGGGLSLDGEVTGIRGVLPMVLKAKEEGIRTCLLPAENVREGAAVSGMKCVGFHTLEEVMGYLNLSEEQRDEEFPPERNLFDTYSPAGCGVVGCAIKTAASDDVKEERIQREDDCAVSERDSSVNGALAGNIFSRAMEGIPDFGDVRGQEGVKRGLEIAAAGFHNLLMVGPPGSGKSMMAKCLPGILPPLSLEESLEVSSIYSIAGELPEGQALITRRPYLSPHHSITVQALAGGGSYPKPGVISLAHRGVLFLDELPEFGRECLNVLRQPLEDHRIIVSRSTGNYEYPTRFMLIGAMNPCPCGYYPDRKMCTCTQPEIHRYMLRVPGPILDRFDICVDAPKVPVELLMVKGGHGERSADIRTRVLAAREIQRERFAKLNGQVEITGRETGVRNRRQILFNADMGPAEVEKFCVLNGREKKFIREIFHSMNLSARAYHKILKVARTIADLEGAPDITEDHLAEAVGYRTNERGGPTAEGM